LPDFLHAAPGKGASSEELAAAWRLTGYFLNRDVYGPRGLEPPESRAAFIAALQKALIAAPTE
jgi:DNA repair protein RecO (recombination protein O)